MEKESDYLVNFLIYLNDKGLINNHDFDYEKEAKEYVKTITIIVRTDGCFE